MDDNRDVHEAYTVFVTQLIQSFVKCEVHPKVIQFIVHSYSVLEVHQCQQLCLIFKEMTLCIICFLSCPNTAHGSTMNHFN